MQTPHTLDSSPGRLDQPAPSLSSGADDPAEHVRGVCREGDRPAAHDLAAVFELARRHAVMLERLATDLTMVATPPPESLGLRRAIWRWLDAYNHPRGG